MELIRSLLPGLIVFAVLYLIYSKFLKSKSGQEPAVDNSGPITATMTLEELSQYDGVKKPTVYIAVKDLVFDVTNSKSYKAGGSYAKLAGKDCSIALARMSMDEKYLNCYPTYQMNFLEKASLERWVGTMTKKYKIMARLSYPDKKND